LLEEAAEAVDALHSGDHEAIVEELGDVLLQIAFHAVIAEQTKSFCYQDIETAIVEKLIRRHPHVFGTTEVKDAVEVVMNWQAIKAQEKKPENQLDGVPQSLPALMRATELGKKRGWAAPDKERLRADLEHLDAESVGEFLLQLALFAKAQGVNPELALRDACSRRLD
jgi:XTP/dITP diphosphohydrolase